VQKFPLKYISETLNFYCCILFCTCTVFDFIHVKTNQRFSMLKFSISKARNPFNFKFCEMTIVNKRTQCWGRFKLCRMFVEKNCNYIRIKYLFYSISKAPIVYNFRFLTSSNLKIHYVLSTLK
jgi:hypothetical protein